MNISLPETLKSYTDDQVSERGFGSTSEYVRDLIRADRDRQQLRSLLLEGANSPADGPIDAAFFESLRARL